jgi:hypothetical protein
MTRARCRSAHVAALATITAAAMLSGCGGGDAPAGKTAVNPTAAAQVAVRQVLADLQTASRVGDGKRICGQIFTPKLADSVTKSAKSGSCATEVKAKLFSKNADIAVENVDVSNAVNASATITETSGNTSTVFLVKQSGRWRIRSVEAA